MKNYVMSENGILHNRSCQVLDVFMFFFTVCYSAELEETGCS